MTLYDSAHLWAVDRLLSKKQALLRGMSKAEGAWVLLIWPYERHDTSCSYCPSPAAFLPLPVRWESFRKVPQLLWKPSGTRTVTRARRGSSRGWHGRGGAVAAILCRGSRRCEGDCPREPGRGRWPRVVRLQVWERMSVTRRCAFLSCNSLMEASGLNLMQDNVFWWEDAFFPRAI